MSTHVRVRVDQNHGCPGFDRLDRCGETRGPCPDNDDICLFIPVSRNLCAFDCLCAEPRQGSRAGTGGRRLDEISSRETLLVFSAPFHFITPEFAISD
jgi:hypothetical protein